jgi:hypothetical protein
MEPFIRRQCGVLLVFILLGITAVGVAAQEGPIQPSLRLIVSDDSGSMTEEEAEARRLIFAAIEARFAGQYRYRMSRTSTSLEPELYTAETDLTPYDAVLFLRLSSRLDGTARFDYDVWYRGSFVRSGEEQLPVGEDRFSTVDQIADDLTEVVGAQFDGFGRLRFTNTGFDQNYYVRIDDIPFGANLEEIDLPVGTYEIVIRRRDDGFSQVVGRRSITLRRDDFYEIVFRMDRTAPPVPGYLRLTNPNERWRAIFTIRGSGIIPLEGFEDQEMDTGWSTTATALFGDVPFRGFVLGFEAGYLRYTATETIEDPFGDVDVDIYVNMTPVLGTLGLTVGPVSGVDFIARGGAGVAIYETKAEVEFMGTKIATERESRIDPVVNGTAEFGYGFGDHFRVSAQIAFLQVFGKNDPFSWIQLGFGIGGRF